MLGDRTTRPFVIVGATALTGVLLTACGGADPSPRPSPTATTATGPTGPAAACSEVLNERDRTVFLDGRNAALDVTGAALARTTPSEADLGRWRRALEDGHAQLDADLTALRSASEAPEWDDVLVPLQREADTYLDRLALVEGAWPVDPSVDLVDPPSPEVDPDAALETLDLVGRDCESLVREPGPVPAHRDFVVAAAAACSTILERRVDLDVPALRTTSLEIVAQVVAGQQVEVTDAEVTALRDLRDEWERTVADLDAVAQEAPDAEAWTATRQLAQDRVEVYSERLAALESGDQDAIGAAFAPGTLAPSAWPWDALGLQLRDCRSIDA